MGHITLFQSIIHSHGYASPTSPRTPSPSSPFDDISIDEGPEDPNRINTSIFYSITSTQKGSFFDILEFKNFAFNLMKPLIIPQFQISMIFNDMPPSHLYFRSGVYWFWSGQKKKKCLVSSYIANTFRGGGGGGGGGCR